MPLYLTIMLCSISIPLIFSFDKKICFYKKWPSFFLSALMNGTFFILIDIYFTKKGIWGFNPYYNSGIFIAGLPLEEWLFFIIIPYSSIFIHYVFITYFPRAILPDGLMRIVTAILLLGLILIIITNTDRKYTLFCSSIMTFALIISLFDKNTVINRFYISFLIILIPLFIINGILTGSFIKNEIVWYKASEIIGIRILTIPVEDFAYGFSLILINLLLMGYLQKLFNKKTGRKNDPYPQKYQ
jgi:lycopene cyclase domain-containing protein